MAEVTKPRQFVVAGFPFATLLNETGKRQEAIPGSFVNEAAPTVTTADTGTPRRRRQLLIAS